jgi:hypothetical protein
MQYLHSANMVDATRKVRVPAPNFLVGCFVRFMPKTKTLYDKIFPFATNCKHPNRWESKISLTPSQSCDVTSTVIICVLLAYVEMFINHNQIYMAKVAILATRQQLEGSWTDSERPLRTMIEDGIRALHYACATDGRPLGHNQFSRVLEACIPVFCTKKQWKFLDRIHPVNYLREVFSCTTGMVTKAPPPLPHLLFTLNTRALFLPYAYFSVTAASVCDRLLAYLNGQDPTCPCEVPVERAKPDPDRASNNADRRIRRTKPLTAPREVETQEQQNSSIYNQQAGAQLPITLVQSPFGKAQSTMGRANEQVHPLPRVSRQVPSDVQVQTSLEPEDGARLDASEFTCASIRGSFAACGEGGDQQGHRKRPADAQGDLRGKFLSSCAYADFDCLW